MNSDVLKRICILKPKRGENTEIILKSGINEIGRSKETKIKDVRCSKRQLLLDVDLKKCLIRSKVLGINPCGINGFMAMHGHHCDLKHGDIIEIVYGRHQFEVCFKPPPPIQSEESERNKPCSTSTKLIPMEVDLKTTPNAENSCWESADGEKLVMFTKEGVRSSNKIAAYDLDGTIIKTKSGNVFPKSYDDWQLIYTEVPGKLKSLFEDNYKICIFTNQAGISRGKTDLRQFKKKIEMILAKLSIPVQVFIAVSDGYYRKPIPGMWNHLQEKKNEGIPIRKEKSFFVGDAAGRPESGAGPTKRKKDHSCADRLFAMNVGLSFYTPEEHFLGHRRLDWIKPDFHPKNVDNLMPLLEPNNVKIPSSECEVIILVGLPGSGKSHFARIHLEPLGYSILNADILRSTQACLSKCEKLLQNKTPCVIDNTNVDIESRKKFVDIARRYSISCRCFVMNTSLPQIKHNIAFRQLIDQKHSKINEMILNSMKKKFKEPTMNEGFREIAKVNLILKFSDVKHQELYKLYLLEKY